MGIDRTGRGTVTAPAGEGAAREPRAGAGREAYGPETREPRAAGTRELRASGTREAGAYGNREARVPEIREAGAYETRETRAAEAADPRVTALAAAVARLRGDLAAHPADLRDRAPAEEALAELAAMAAGGAPDVARLHRALLVVAGAVGSVSAVAPAVAEVRDVIELFGRAPRK